MWNTIGERIKKQRKECGISQAKLAEKIGIKKSTLSAYETNVNDIPGKILLKIAEELETSVDYLLFGKKVDNEEEILIKFLFDKIRTPALRKLAIKQIRCILEIVDNNSK